MPNHCGNTSTCGIGSQPDKHVGNRHHYIVPVENTDEAKEFFVRKAALLESVK